MMGFRHNTEDELETGKENMKQRKRMKEKNGRTKAEK